MAFGLLRISLLSLCILLPFLVHSAGSQEENPVQVIGREFHSILKSLQSSTKTEDRVDVLQTALSRFEALEKRVYLAFRGRPDQHSAQERIVFHLRYMIKWTRYLIQKAGAIPGMKPRSPGQAAHAKGKRLLEEARRYEREHPEDRMGIVDRYLVAIELVRGKPEEREVVKRLNRIWSEVSPGASVASEPGKASGQKPKNGSHSPLADPSDRTRQEDSGDVSRKPHSPEALKKIREDLQGGDLRARKRAVQILADVDQSWVGGFLVRRLAEEKDAQIQKVLTEAVLKVGNRHVVSALGKWSRFKDQERKQLAIRLLGQVGGKEAGKALSLFLKNTSQDTIRLLVATAKGLKDGHGVQSLAMAVKAFPSLRFDIIEALGETGHSSAARVLISFLHRRKYPESKDPAIKSLRVLGPQAIPTLIEALGGRDYRQYAAAALRSVTGQRFGMSSGRWQQWWRKNKKKFESGGR